MLVSSGEREREREMDCKGKHQREYNSIVQSNKNENNHNGTVDVQTPKQILPNSIQNASTDKLKQQKRKTHFIFSLRKGNDRLHNFLLYTLQHSFLLLQAEMNQPSNWLIVTPELFSSDKIYCEADIRICISITSDTTHPSFVFKFPVRATVSHEE